MKKCTWLEIVYFFLVSVSIVLMPVCGSAFDSKWWAQWKLKNDHENRYEGLIEVPYSKGGGFELLSFTGHMETFTGNVELKVNYYVPVGLSGDKYVLIEGQELKRNKKYRMESYRQLFNRNWQEGQWNVFQPWQTRTVLTREGIPHWNIGVLALLYRTHDDQALRILPAVVYHSQKPKTVVKYSLHLRPGHTLKAVEYKLYRIVNLKEEKIVGPVLMPGDFIEGEPFDLYLEMRNISEGEMRLVIDGALKYGGGSNGKENPHDEYRFYHMPIIE